MPAVLLGGEGGKAGGVPITPPDPGQDSYLAAAPLARQMRRVLSEFDRKGVPVSLSPCHPTLRRPCRGNQRPACSKGRAPARPCSDAARGGRALSGRRAPAPHSAGGTGI